ncbi:MAG: glycosyltransferase family 4 protein [Candidatus Hodarchaeota archaeon]
MSSIKRVGMFLYNEFPQDERVRREALFLTRHGHKVSVFAIKINPKEKTRDVFHGITIYRIFTLPNLKTGVRAKYLIFFWISCIMFINKNKLLFDVIHCHDLTTLPAGVFMKIINSLKLVYDSHEFFPEAASKKMGFIYGVICLTVERTLIRFSDRIIGVSIPQAIIMKKRYSLNNFLIIRNTPMLDRPYPSTIKGKRLLELNKKKINIVNAGSLIPDRGHYVLLSAIEKLRQKYDDFHVYILGRGPLLPVLKEEIKERKIEAFVTVKGHVPPQYYFDFLSQFDIGLSLYQDTFNNRYSQPNTLYDYMLAGLAIIFPCYPGNYEGLREVGAIKVEPAIERTVIEAIEHFLKDKNRLKHQKRISRERFEKKFNWENINTGLITLYRDL